MSVQINILKFYDSKRFVLKRHTQFHRMKTRQASENEGDVKILQSELIFFCCTFSFREVLTCTKWNIEKLKVSDVDANACNTSLFSTLYIIPERNEEVEAIYHCYFSVEPTFKRFLFA